MLLIDGCPLRLKFLNQDKTQHVWLCGRAQLSRIDFDSLRLKFPNVNFSSSVCDLGFILDRLYSLLLTMSIVYVALISTTYANSVSFVGLQ